MGSRLGALIRSQTGWEIYYDHWAAQTIGIDIALDGVEATLERVRRMQPMGVHHPREWEGAAWIEGTLLIDQVRQMVVWAEESQMRYAPRLINRMIEFTWPGWTAVWSAEGTRGVIQACGVNSATLFPVHESDGKLSAEAYHLYPWEKWHGSDPITVILPDERHVTWYAYAILDDFARLGPDRFLEIAETVARREERESVGWIASQEDEPATRGIFVDFPRRQIQWWSFGDADMHIPVFDQLWGEWQITCRGDDYSWHEQVLGDRIRAQELDIAEFEECVREALEEGPRENPFIRMANALHAAGETVSPFPSVLQFEAAERASDIGEVLRFIATLREGSVPPARNTTAQGKIVPPIGSDRTL